ncbi:hypothetical protein BS329_27535 [Amycolatopsis coloradensis]|uniref:Uncharacterized protein n=1 Tax=Amycolatopsis coloradensis TaxID=76021 RepID=A0A1R0KLU3_9PSEU|nr:hypothetical protein [Amycolatopsis coloradensis]OLZ47638.1 hypothetical protein BS329_27535 [Amycolatopsis coloradensis]
MLDTGDTSPPGPRHLHMVRPNQPVWVDLKLVYAVGPAKTRLPDGLDLTATVPGLLGMWRATTTGHWVGWVTFQLGPVGRGGTTHSQWVLAEALRPREQRNAWSGSFPSERRGRG